MFVQLAANQTASGADLTVQFFQTLGISGQFLVAGASNGQRTLTRFKADHTTDVFGFGTLGTVSLPATVTGDPTAVVKGRRGADTV